MPSSRRATKTSPPINDSLRRLQPALRQLLDAREYSRDVGADVWDFAVEIQSLQSASCTTADLRWLICKGFVEAAAESTKPGSKKRSFRRKGRHPFSEKTRFVVTETGAKKLALTAALIPPDESPTDSKPRVIKPEWDPDRRELRIGGCVVKQFRVPAENQQLILTAFQEMDWPTHLDDPLPPVPNQEPKRRLHKVISRLNHNQKTLKIRFHADGTGKGIHWELVEGESDG